MKSLFITYFDLALIAIVLTTNFILTSLFRNGLNNVAVSAIIHILATTTNFISVYVGIMVLIYNKLIYEFLVLGIVGVKLKLIHIIATFAITFVLQISINRLNRNYKSVNNIVICLTNIAIIECMFILNNIILPPLK